MSTAIKGARYLFSILQSALVHPPTSPRIRLTPLLKAALSDWQALAEDLATHPVPISSLVPRAPHFIGAVDASQQGLGGFWLPTQHASQHQPLLFRCDFPPSIQQQLVSAKNPTGTLTNSDLELAAIILGTATLAEHTNMQHDSLWCGSDNAPAVSWSQKGSPTSTKANAFLLRWLAQLACRHQFNLLPISIAGKTNELADFCSRSFSLSDQAFAKTIQSTYPVTPCWKIVRPSNDNVSAMISALSSTMSPWGHQRNASPYLTPSGKSGQTSVPASTPTQPYPPPPTQSCSCKYLPIVTVGENYLPVGLQLEAKRWATPFVPLGRRYPTWDTQTRASYPLAS